MDDQLLQQEPAVTAQAFLELAEANVSPLTNDHAWEDQVGFLHAAEDRQDRDATVMVRDVLNDALMSSY
jgi:hypothetical protein